jgi:hypothetical protein
MVAPAAAADATAVQAAVRASSIKEMAAEQLRQIVLITTKAAQAAAAQAAQDSQAETIQCPAPRWQNTVALVAQDYIGIMELLIAAAVVAAQRAQLRLVK